MKTNTGILTIPSPVQEKSVRCYPFQLLHIVTVTISV